MVLYNIYYIYHIVLHNNIIIVFKMEHHVISNIILIICTLLLLTIAFLFEFTDDISLFALVAFYYNYYFCYYHYCYYHPLKTVLHNVQSTMRSCRAYLLEPDSGNNTQDGRNLL